jgi:hypothetical protein
MQGNEQHCFHCGLDLPPQPWRFEYAGQWRSFCCAGCMTVARTILEGGLQDYYQRREGYDAAPTAPDANGGASADDSRWAVYDERVPWIADESAMVRRALDAGAGVLGVCFGGQLLASALGGVGFLDDFIKIRRARNRGLNKTAKTVGQIVDLVDVGPIQNGSVSIHLACHSVPSAEALSAHHQFAERGDGDHP